MSQNEILTYHDDVVQTLNHWVNIHTIAQEWAVQWSAGDYQEWADKINEEHKVLLKNDYFSFDIALAARKIAMGDWEDEFICDECGQIFDYEPDVCEECESDNLCLLARDESELEYCGFVTVEDFHVEQAFLEQAFPVYREALEPVTCGVEEEIAENLEALEQAFYGECAYEFLAALQQATQVQHVHGNIMDDYNGQWDIDTIRNEGFADVFGQEEIDDLVANWGN